MNFLRFKKKEDPKKEYVELCWCNPAIYCPCPAWINDKICRCGKFGDQNDRNK